MKKMITDIKYWSQILLLPVYLLSFCSVRSNKIWVLGSSFGQRFADNPRYFFLYLSQVQQEGIQAIWISKEKSIIEHLKKNNLKAYYLYSFQGIWNCLRAKVYLFDNYSKDICFTLSGGARKINLWHGIPLKKIQMDNVHDKVRYPDTGWQRIKWMLRRMSDEKPSHYILCTSEFLRNIFESSFRTKNVIMCGYPRNDVLISDTIRNVLLPNEEQVCKSMDMHDGKIVVYMPTFRDSEKQLMNILDFDKFHMFLQNNNILFCMKLHPKSRLENLIRTKLQNRDLKYIRFINSNNDPYPIVKKADILVTDYSSIYFDYLLMDRPIVFFDYDREEYLRNTREMYFNYEEFTPGVKVKSAVELEAALLAEDDYSAERAIVRQKVFSKESGLASERLYQAIKQQ